jgi:hypothetical protein
MNHDVKVHGKCKTHNQGQRPGPDDKPPLHEQGDITACTQTGDGGSRVKRNLNSV